MYRILPLSIAGLFLAGLLAAAPASKEFRRTVPLASRGRVELRSERGTAHITPWNRDEVEVVATIQARPETRDPEESVRRTEIRFDATSGSVRIETDFGDRTWSRGWLDGERDAVPLVHYEIKVPRTVDLTVDDNRSEIQIGDLHGRLRLETDRSSIQVASLSGALSVEADRGTIGIGQLALTERSDFHTDRTEVDLGLASNHGLVLDLDLDRVSPSVDTGLVAGTIREARHHVTYRGSIGAGGPVLQYTADRGSLRLRRS